MSFQALLHLRQRLKRRRRRIAFVIGVGILVSVAIWGVLVEGTLLRKIVAWQIGSRLGANCTIASFSWNGWNRAVIRGLSVRVDDWPEIASEVISIGEMSADFDPLPLLWGSLALTDISVDRMTIRVIERGEARELNLLGLQIPETRATTLAAPRINIRDLALQVGVLEEGGRRVKYDGQQDLVGSVTSDDASRGQWRLQLTQKGAGDGTPATLEGTLAGHDFSYSVTLKNLSLDDSLQRLLPLGVRQMWEEMHIRGRVDAVTLAGSRDQTVREAKLKVSNVTVTLPNLSDDQIWARYTFGSIVPERGGPRILVKSGEMEFHDWMLVLREFRGELTSADETQSAVPLPVSLSFWLDLERGRTRDWSRTVTREWFESALEHAPFGLQLQVENYTMREVDGKPPTLELPRLAAEILHNFQVRQGRVSINAFVSRDDPYWRREEPGPDEPLEGPIGSEIQVRGSLFINEGEGAYFKFPYLLKDVKAHITFENDQVSVEQLRGRGSGGSEIIVSGSVLEPGDDAGVDLRILTARAPIDDALEAALVESPAQRFLKLLFCRPAFDSLRAAGLPESEVARLQAKRGRILESVSGPQAATELRRTSAIDWLSKFSPGGWCGLDLRVRRDVGGGDMVETTGTIILDEADALCEPLPYPLHVLGRDEVGVAAATITIEDERITLPEGGLRIQLPGGGSGSIQGWIDLPRTSGNDRIVTPHLTVRTGRDSINELFLAAIPADNPNGPIVGPSDGWPGRRRSEAATLLDEFGVRGTLDSVIDIGGDGKGAITWRVHLELSEGEATPKQSLASDMAESGLEWPAGFDLDRCRALITIDEREARLVEFEGHADEGTVRASGRLDLVTLDRELSVDFDNISADEYLVNLLPHADREVGHAFWRKHEPTGAFDASLRWARHQDGHADRELRVTPRWFSFTAAPRRVPGAESDAVPGLDTSDWSPPVAPRAVFLEHREGELVIVGPIASAKNLRLQVDEAGLGQSMLSLDGTLSAPPHATAPALRAQWDDADLSSGLLLEGLALAGAREATALWRDLRPTGRFDADLRRDAIAPGREPSFLASISLERAQATVNGAETTLDVEPGSAPIEIRPPFIRFSDFRARTPNGRLACRGVVPLDSTVVPDSPFLVSYHGDRLGDAELALAGRGARHAAEAIELVCDGPVHMDDGEVRFTRLDDAMVPAFKGEIRVDHASFRAGAAFTDLEARVALDVPPTGGADIRIDATSYRVMNRPVRDAFARVRVSPGASTIDINPITGTIAGGAASATALVRIDAASTGGGDYRVGGSLVGAQLSEIPATPTGYDETGPGRFRHDGRIDASFLIGGPLALPERRAGRGQIEIRDGRMAELPITLSLIQVTQLMLPLNTALDSGDIRFVVDGSRLTFERFDLTCPTLQFRGSGGMDLRTDELALRFRTRGTVPLWSDIFAAVSETLYAVDVTGTASKPVVSVAPLPPFNRAPSTRADSERHR